MAQRDPAILTADRLREVLGPIRRAHRANAFAERMIGLGMERDAEPVQQSENHSTIEERHVEATRKVLPRWHSGDTVLLAVIPQFVADTESATLDTCCRIAEDWTGPENGCLPVMMRRAISSSG